MKQLTAELRKANRVQCDLNELYEHSDKSIQVDNCLNHIVKELQVKNALNKLFLRIDNKEKVLDLVKTLDHSTITMTDYNLIKEWLGK